jgi:hypothetical protein
MSLDSIKYNSKESLEDKKILKELDIEQIEKNILEEEDKLKNDIIDQSQDQIDSQPIEKLKDWRIQFPYKYGKYEALLYLKKDEKGNVVVSGTYTFDWKKKDTFNTNITGVKSLQDFATKLWKILDDVTTKWRKSAYDKSKETYNLLYPGAHQKELEGKDYLERNDEEKMMKVDFIIDWVNTKRDVILSMKYNSVKKEVDVVVNIMNNTWVMFWKSDKEKDLVLKYKLWALTTLWSDVEEKFKNGIQFEDENQKNKIITVEDKNTLDRIRNQLIDASDLLAYKVAKK